METKINISNDNWGYISGATTLFGSSIDSFFAEGTIAYQTDSNKIIITDGSYLNFSQNGVEVSIKANGGHHATLDRTSEKINLIFDNDEGTYDVTINKDGDPRTVNLDLVGTLSLDRNTGAIDLYKDFVLNFSERFYDGFEKMFS